MKKVAVIGNAKSYLFKRLHEESHPQLSLHSFLDVRVEMKDGEVVIYFGDTLATDYSAVYFYAIGSKKPEAQEIAHFLASHGVRILDPAIASRDFPLDKLYLGKQGHLHYPPSTFYSSLKRDDLAALTYPSVFKVIGKSKGRGISLIENEQEARDFLDENGSMLIVQKPLAIDHDYRVIIINGRALGAVRRDIASGSTFATTKGGGKRNLAVIPHEILANIEQAVVEKGLFLAGVDLAFADDKYYCFEINSSPQIKVTEHHTGVNVAGNLIEGLLNPL
jgi:glutathione synthase/RimK-type ligase-like ATP-grasp enzyme